MKVLCFAATVVTVLGCAAATQAALFDIETKLTAADAAAGDHLGRSVAISGNTALVGAPRNGDTGSAYLFDVTTGNQTKLTTDDAMGGHRFFGVSFGSSVAISGNTALVGAHFDDSGGRESGSAYLFDVTTGDQIAKLTADDAAAYDDFGFSVAISGNTALVGAHRNDDAGAESGSAYLFDATTGNQIAKLTADDAVAVDRFGISVAVSGNMALIGSESGSAYLFDVTTGNQIAKLTADDAAEFDGFGSSVAISGNTALVGAPYDDSTGSAYLFDVTTGGQIAKLTADDAALFDDFGVSVAISGNTALVGGWFEADVSVDPGSAYLFDVTTGNQLAKITADDAGAHDWFGYTVAISGNTALVGAFGDDDGASNSGSAYLFENIPEPSGLLLGVMACLGIFFRRDR